MIQLSLLFGIKLNIPKHYMNYKGNREYNIQACLLPNLVKFNYFNDEHNN